MTQNNKKCIRAIEEHDLYNDPKFKHSFKKLDFKEYACVERDGNCLYTSLSLAVFNHIRESQKMNKFLDKKELFEKLGVSDIVYETYIESLEQILSSITDIDLLSNDEKLVFIGYLRLVISSHLRINSEFYANFIEKMTVEEYVKRFVDPMGERAGEIEISAFCSEFGFKIEVVSIDEKGLTTKEYGEGEKFYILHTPDHFEPLFK